MTKTNLNLILITTIIYVLISITLANNSCYDSKSRKAKRCIPDFRNVAYGLRSVSVSNTCGMNGERTEYCVQSSLHSQDEESSSEKSKKCSYCDSQDPRRRHPSDYLTDFHSQGTITWWQSETMYEDIQYPKSVNITMDLERTYEITYIKLIFHSPRPESFAIYKKTHKNSDWIPYQFYSASCSETYGLHASNEVKRGNEAIALCSNEYSDISPLTGSPVAFSTLEFRPSSYQFDSSDELKEWVTASSIKIVLNRLNTFGDEIFNDKQVLQSYYYAISDISIGGRCKCNGHASNCAKDANGHHKCVCEHNTAGDDCERCAPFYNALPWKPATNIDAHECQPCNCNGLSDECVFDEVLYESSGNGGRCVNCRGNRDGPRCEYCKEGFFRLENDIACTDCGCNPIGSESKQCDPSGKCKCRPGITGEKCDQCAPNHFGMSVDGCKACSCNVNGSFDSPPYCNPIDGNCRCKANVEGRDCDQCKPGHFNLDASNPLGCQKCFCHGHSSDCTSADNYKISSTTSSELSLNQLDLLKVSNSHSANTPKQSKALYDQSDDTVIIPFDSEFSNGNVWLLAPSEYLGNKLLSYNQELSFEMRLGGGDVQKLAPPTRKDILLENSNSNGKMSIGIAINAGNQMPSSEFQKFTFRLSESASWTPSLNSHQFQRLLSNLTSIKIRANFINSETFIKNITLASAALLSEDDDNFNIAKFVEKCTCPVGYAGQFCDLCAYGFKRENPLDTLFSKCIPCTCNNHSISCDPTSGECSCQHDTTGHNCDKCLHGFYGNPLKGTADDCKECPCPNKGACIELYNFIEQKNDVVCTECPEGTEGNLCEYCSDGFFSEDARLKSCEPCKCNENIDLNAIGNCDKFSGKCLRCTYNTTGDLCEKCLPGYWGNALSELKCHACECYALGTKETSGFKENFGELQCNLLTGNCDCKQNVAGRQCNECLDGFWNISSGEGCVDCHCNVLGSFNASCNVKTGQCFCRPGVTGLKCDKCLPNYFDFDEDGCKACDCDAFGSASLQCDNSGKCVCKENISGYKCNKCEENKFNYTSGCLACPDCYNLVQKKSHGLKDKIKSLQDALNLILQENSLKPENDEANKELEDQLLYVQGLINELHFEVFNKSNFENSYQATVAALYEQFNLTRVRLREIDVLFGHFAQNFSLAHNLYKHNSELLKKIGEHLGFIKELMDKYGVNISEQHGNAVYSENNLKMQELAQQAREATKHFKSLVETLIVEVGANIDKTNNLLEFFNKLKANFTEMDSFIKNLQMSVDGEADSLVEKAKEAKKMLLSKIEYLKEAIENVSKYDTESEKEIFESFAAETSSLKNSLSESKLKIDEFNVKFKDFSESNAEMRINKTKIRLDKLKIKQAELQTLNDTSTTDYEKALAANNLTREILKNASNTVEVLRNFDESIKNSKMNAENAAKLIPDIEKNIEDSMKYSEKIMETLPKINVNSVVNRDISLDKLSDDYKNLNENSKELVQKSENVVAKFKELPSASKLKELNNSLLTNFTQFEEQAERLAVNSTDLLAQITNNLEAFDQTDKYINEFLQQNLSIDDVNKLIEKFAKVSAELSKKSEAFNSEIDDLEKNNKMVLKQIDSMRIQVSVLSEQVLKLDLLNKTLVENSALCPYSEGQTIELL